MTVIIMYKLNQVSAQFLLPLDSLEQRLEVTSTEAGEVMSLDDLDEDGRTVHHVLRPLEWSLGAGQKDIPW